jgi:hypothetical protein
MPNWCYNNMSVHGDRESLEKLTTAITRKDDDGNEFHDLTVLFPVPEELQIKSVWFSTESTDPEYLELSKKYEANKEKYGFQTWYDWSIANWGTKWSPRIEEWEISHYNDESTINANYDTAWSPADGLIREVSRQFPTLLFSVTSDEEGGSFACCEAYKNGELVAGFGLSLPDDEAMPEDLRVRRQEIDKAMEGDYDSDEYIRAWDDHHDWNNDVKQYCEDMAWNELRDKGLIPRLGV